MRFFGTFIAVFAALLVFFFVGPIILISIIAGLDTPTPLPEKMVLTLDLRAPIGDAPGETGLPAAMGGTRQTVIGIVDALEKASTDDSVKGLYIRGGGLGAGINPGQAEEVRNAIADFKGSGRFVISHVQDLMSLSIGPYYMVSVADELWMQSSGGILAQGLGTSRMFFKNTLDKLDSAAQVQHYYEYKTAMHGFIHDDLTEPQKEADTRLLRSVFDEMIEDIATSREMSAAEIESALADAPFLGQEAVDAGWVDKLGFDIDAENAALDRAGADAELIGVSEYSARAGSAYDEGAVIAFIHGEGPVVEGEAEASFFGGSGVMAGDTIARAIRNATDDEDVRAIVFRVNSPGGSPGASDQIWHAIEEAQAANKPVIVNMAGVAASGGYWVAMGADKIVAQPTTITGSIGVVGGKFILKGAYEKLGITVRELGVGGDKLFMYSDQHEFSNQEWLALTEIFDGIYGTFIDKVADGRGLPVSKVQQLARGRVWSGADAHSHELIDELGGFKTAIALAKEAAGIGVDESVEIRRFPEQLSFYEQLALAFGASAQVAQTFAHAAEILQLEPVAEVIDEIKHIESVRGTRVQTVTDVKTID